MMSRCRGTICMTVYKTEGVIQKLNDFRAGKESISLPVDQPVIDCPRDSVPCG